MQADLQAAAHQAWRTYRDDITAEGRKDRRSLRAREFFAGFEAGKEYGRRVEDANRRLKEIVQWAEQDPALFQQWMASNPETVEALREALLYPDERTPFDGRSR